jgi:sarcosine oxidase
VARVAVVGAGVMGLATAHALARAGCEVVVYEQFGPGHARGSSHGRSRIFRLAYPEPRWVRLAQEALAGWRELEAETGEQLLELNGLLEIVRDLSESSAPALDACGVAWERLEREVVERRFPLRVPPGFFCLLQHEAGIVLADRALAGFARRIEVRYGTRVASLAELEADCTVVTAGAWVNHLVDPPLAVRVTRETICYFRQADARPTPAVVSFKEQASGHQFYALADPQHGLKVGAHHWGPEVHPRAEVEPDPGTAEAISAWAAQHLALADPHPVEVGTCLYTSTADESFVLERRGRIVVGSACSGHGFKFAPAVGARLAALALEVLNDSS